MTITLALNTYCKFIGYMCQYCHKWAMIIRKITVGDIGHIMKDGVFSSVLVTWEKKTQKTSYRRSPERSSVETFRLGNLMMHVLIKCWAMK